MKNIFDILLKNYSRQNWWPATSEKKIKSEYHNEHKTEKQKLEVMIGAILVQNTNWKNAEKALIKLIKNDLMDIDRLLEIDEKELALLIKSSGYFNQKAKKLKNLALFLKENPIKKLQELEIKELRKLLLDVKGIGPETADSIILYAFNKPIFVIDAYTKRIFSRLGLVDKTISYDELQELFHNNLEKDAELFNEYHALIVEHAKRHCKSRPLCGNCLFYRNCLEKY